VTEDDPIIAYQGQVQLLGWGDTSTRGRTITLQLSDDSDAHPFSTARTKQGKTAGQRYQIVMVQLGADEQPVEKTPSQMAFLLCQKPAFQHWLNERSFVPITDEDSARAYICEGCGIKSRSELDKDPVARSAWLVQFYNPWMDYESKLNKVL
jgi:hypothetical protein